MDYRRLAGTDLNVSVLCFGPMRSAQKDPGEDPRSRAGARALSAALDHGINFVHSSYEYGVRWMMNEVLKKHPLRHDIHHVIKVPVPDWGDGNGFDEVKFRSRVEEALRDLAAERISVVQWMWRTDPDDEALRLTVLPRIVEDVVAAFERLKTQGKVGHLMTFPYTVASGRAAIETNRFSGLIAYMNLLEMEMADALPELAERGLGFVCIRPLYQGVLTDRRPSQSALPSDDRLKQPEHATLFSRRDAVSKHFEEEIDGSMTRFAMRFPLFSPVVASIVLGLNSENQVREAVRMMDAIVPRPDLIERARELWKSDFRLPLQVVGTRRPA